jgi:hypothetical protein
MQRRSTFTLVHSDLPQMYEITLVANDDDHRPVGCGACRFGSVCSCDGRERVVNGTSVANRATKGETLVFDLKVCERVQGKQRVQQRRISKLSVKICQRCLFDETSRVFASFIYPTDLPKGEQLNLNRACLALVAKGVRKYTCKLTLKMP